VARIIVRGEKLTPVKRGVALIGGSARWRKRRRTADEKSVIGENRKPVRVARRWGPCHGRRRGHAGWLGAQGVREPAAAKHRHAHRPADGRDGSGSFVPRFVTAARQLGGLAARRLLVAVRALGRRIIHRWPEELGPAGAAAVAALAFLGRAATGASTAGVRRGATAGPDRHRQADRGGEVGSKGEAGAQPATPRLPGVLPSRRAHGGESFAAGWDGSFPKGVVGNDERQASGLE